MRAKNSGRDNITEFKKKLKICLVSAPYYKDITDNLVCGALNILKKIKADTEIVEVSGALEIPTAIKLMENEFDGFIAIGCVIRGETTHYDYVCSESARALMNISLEGFAIGYGILTVENYNQALIRSKTIANKSLGKGKVAALACINQMRLKAKYTDGR